MAASVVADIQRGVLHVPITKRWDGSELAVPHAGGHAALRLASMGHLGLRISFTAPFYNGALPPPITDASRPTAGPVRCDGLWEYECLELFLVAVPPASSEGQGYQYLELEWGPAGHFLALKLAGCRNVFDHMLDANLNYGTQGHVEPAIHSLHSPLTSTPLTTKSLFRMDC